VTSTVPINAAMQHRAYALAAVAFDPLTMPSNKWSKRCC